MREQQTLQLDDWKMKGRERERKREREKERERERTTLPQSVSHAHTHTCTRDLGRSRSKGGKRKSAKIRSVGRHRSHRPFFPLSPLLARSTETSANDGKKGTFINYHHILRLGRGLQSLSPFGERSKSMMGFRRVIERERDISDNDRLDLDDDTVMTCVEGALWSSCH